MFFILKIEDLIREMLLRIIINIFYNLLIIILTIFSLFSDLPPGYTYPPITMSYRSGPSQQDVRLAEPADLEAIQVEPAEHAPQSLVSLGEELDCQVAVMPLPGTLPLKGVEPEEEERVAKGGLEQREEVEVTAVTAANYVPEEEDAVDHSSAEDEDILVCPPTESSECEAASCLVPLPTEETNRLETVVTLEEEDDDRTAGGDSQVEYDQNVNIAGEQAPELPAIIELDPASPAVTDSLCLCPEGVKDSEPQHENKMTPDDAPVEFLCQSPASVSACSQSEESVAVPHKPLVPCYWSLELLIAAAFCTDVPPFPLYPYSTPSTMPTQCTPNQGMELLSELAELELQQIKHNCGKSQGERQWVFTY